MITDPEKHVPYWIDGTVSMPSAMFAPARFFPDNSACWHRDFWMIQQSPQAALTSSETSDNMEPDKIFFKIIFGEF